MTQEKFRNVLPLFVNHMQDFESFSIEKERNEAINFSFELRIIVFSLFFSVIFI